MVGVTVSNATKCVPRFLYSWIESIDLSTFANVSAVPSITGSRLKQEKVPLPSLDEQRTIAVVLDSVDAAVKRGREERERLQAVKASAAEALLSGRVRVGV